MTIVFDHADRGLNENETSQFFNNEYKTSQSSHLTVNLLNLLFLNNMDLQFIHFFRTNKYNRQY